MTRHPPAPLPADSLVPPAAPHRSEPRAGVFKTCVTVAATGWSFAFFWGGAMLYSWVYLPLARLFFKDPEAYVEHAQNGVRACWTFFLYSLTWLRLFKLSPRGSEAQFPPGAFVLAANHPTLIDVLLLMTNCPKVCCVVKGGVYNSWMVGNLMRGCAHINGAQDPRDVLDECLNRLQRGYRVLVFPEGTRSPPGDLHPFKRVGFEMAARAQVPVVPVALKCDPPALSKGVPWYRFPRRVVDLSMNVLEPVSIPMDREQVRAAMRQTQSTIAEALDRPWTPPYSSGDAPPSDADPRAGAGGAVGS